jgi:uncharacterized protein (TIGR00730 family)
MTQTIKEARERLRTTVEEYIKLEAELRALEDTNFRVCIFGSARIQPQDPVYHGVFRLAQRLSERGIDVVTGGGPGLMSAANRGVLAAKNQRARSYGLPLDLPSLIEPANPHLDFSSAHKRFSSRLDEFIRLTHAVVVAPGGIGTLLELMYVWQLLQLRTIDPRPTVLLGTEYWGGLLEWVKNAPVALRLADPRDLECVSLVDTPEEALAILDTAHADFLVNQRRGILAEADALTEAARIREATEELADDIARQMHLTEEGLAGWLVAA